MNGLISMLPAPVVLASVGRGGALNGVVGAVGAAPMLVDWLLLGRDVLRGVLVGVAAAPTLVN